MKKLIYLFLITSIIACKSPNTTKVITINTLYTIEIPSNYYKMNDLNEDATLQYGNAFKPSYVIVIDETKQEYINAIAENELEEFYSQDLNGYYDLVTDNFMGSVENPKQSIVVDTIINNMKAKIRTIEARVDNLDILYKVGTYEGKEHFYQVLSWTTLDNKKDQSTKLKNILYTLKEI